jgi:hypothetical protein
VKVLAGWGFSKVVAQRGAVFEHRTGHKLVLQFGEPGALKREIKLEGPEWMRPSGRFCARSLNRVFGLSHCLQRAHAATEKLSDLPMVHGSLFI